MGNKVGAIQKPVIMTKSFLEEKIINELALVEGLNVSELQRLVRLDGIERNFVLSLQLEHQSKRFHTSVPHLSLLLFIPLIFRFISCLYSVKLWLYFYKKIGLKL